MQLDEEYRCFEETYRRAASPNPQHCLVLYTANVPLIQKHYKTPIHSVQIQVFACLRYIPFQQQYWYQKASPCGWTKTLQWGYGGLPQNHKIGGGTCVCGPNQLDYPATIKPTIKLQLIFDKLITSEQRKILFSFCLLWSSGTPWMYFLQKRPTWSAWTPQ